MTGVSIGIALTLPILLVSLGGFLVIRVNKLIQCVLVLLCSLWMTACVTSITSQSNSEGPPEPVTWGVFSKPKGCVIFREYKKITYGFFIVALLSRSHSELQVLESKGYDLQPSAWVQNEENMDKLYKLAMRAGLRFVKVRDNYSPSELTAARELCQEDDVAILKQYAEPSSNH